MYRLESSVTSPRILEPGSPTIDGDRQDEGSTMDLVFVEKKR